jgi:chitin disaccharide deacetylase
MALTEILGAAGVGDRTADVAKASSRRLIINADDFGFSSEINAAVIRAHTHGVLTSASLMVNEDGFEEAVELARQHPSLGVGLHLTLLCGRSRLAPTAIPRLVDAQQQFLKCPVTAGLKYFWSQSLRDELEKEIEAQFASFEATGLQLDHVNGHLHFHLHPTVLQIISRNAERWNIRRIRLTHDPFWMNARLAKGRWGYRIAHAVVFRGLRARARAQFRALGMRHTDYVFGLLQDSHVDESFTARLLQRLPKGDSELYCHPSLTRFKHELEALVSPRVRALISELGIPLVRYQDL